MEHKNSTDWTIKVLAMRVLNLLEMWINELWMYGLVTRT